MSLSSSSLSRHADSTDSLAICSDWPSLLLSPLDGIQCLYRADESMFLLVNQCWCVYRRTSLLSLSLLLQLYPVRLACLTWMACTIGGKWSCHCHFVECCFQDLFKTACSILILLYLAFFLGIFLKPKWCNHTIVLIQLQLGIIPISFYQKELI